MINAFSEIFELEASPVEDQSLQQKDKKKKTVGLKVKTCSLIYFVLICFLLVMDHPERFPTPEASPMMMAQNRNGTVVTDGQVARAEFTLQSSDSSDEDDNDVPPPPYPGLVTSQNDVEANDTRNTTDLNQTNTNNVGEDGNEEPPNEPVTALEAPPVEVVDELSSSTADTHEVPSYLPPATGSVLQERDNSARRNGVELSQSDGPPEEPEMVIMI